MRSGYVLVGAYIENIRSFSLHPFSVTSMEHIRSVMGLKLETQFSILECTTNPTSACRPNPWEYRVCPDGSWVDVVPFRRTSDTPTMSNVMLSRADERACRRGAVTSPWRFRKHRFSSFPVFGILPTLATACWIGQSSFLTSLVESAGAESSFQ